ncbi:hypothetical protein A2Z53_00765 [Candidatus Giovannonibacteria bacterium RIFCSPHIGHO2_02_42_15]|uniref:Uncharacterized protein n=1 Tax=Candidatus Giovannonibacteria bacterium RIFCSPHIGHO2_02_42_15 TaxID=1798329 RepID=A0A1F5VLM1_9BACT|nr:MAG: hypothetical protein A2Z53_00765 [Candidatus Giovannonibacteria bacterium RIFCSPHIGHO2_02_42_15]
MRKASAGKDGIESGEQCEKVKTLSSKHGSLDSYNSRLIGLQLCGGYKNAKYYSCKKLNLNLLFKLI